MALTQVNSNGVKDDSIVNADIKSDAAISLSKLASTPAVLTGSTNNTITTVTGANAIQGEANLTFDGDILQAVGGGSSADGSRLDLKHGNNNTTDVISSVTFSNGAGEAARIQGETSGANNSGVITFHTDNAGTSAERVRIEPDGKLKIGTTATPTQSGALNVFGTDDTTSQVSIRRGSGNSGGPTLHFQKNRNTADDSHTVVLEHDVLGQIVFGGNDGAGPENGAKISAAVDSTPGGNDMPGRLSFSTTPDGSDALVERMRIHNSGEVSIPAGITLGLQADDKTAENTLDDYEEGTFTPVIGGSDNHSTYNQNGSGHYVKVGKLVYISIRFNNINLNDTAAGSVKITGLPFSNDNNIGGAGFNNTLGDSGEYNTVRSTSYWYSWYGGTGTAELFCLITRNGNSWLDRPASDFHAASVYINLSGVYRSTV